MEPTEPPPIKTDSQSRIDLQTQKEIEVASNVLHVLFPEKKFIPFSTEGTSCVVFQEETTSRLYKVGVNKMELHLAQDPRVLSGHLKIPDSEELIPYFTREATSAALLADKDAAPEFYGFISPDMSPDEEAKIKEAFGITDEQFTAYRQLHTPLPIIIMERVNPKQEPKDFNQALNVIDDEVLISEINRLSQILEELHLFPGDTEIVWDIEHQRLIFLDTGAMTQEPFMNQSGGFLTAREHILRLLPPEIQERVNNQT